MRQYWWWLLILIVPAQAGHFYGGGIRWTPLNASATTSPIQIVISQSYSYTLTTVTCSIGALLGTTGIGYNYNLSCTLNCGATSAGYIPPPVLGYCTGSNSALNVAFSQRIDVVNLTSGDYFSVSFGILNTLTSGYYRELTLTAGNTTTTAHWNITTAIDVRVRPDNGRINTPPVSNMMSPRGIPLNVPTQVLIPTLDLDNDNVRCRWSNTSLECGNVCFPVTIPSSANLLSNCTLNIIGTSLTDWYAGSVQVEDYYSSSSTVALSSTPVQFLIYVYAPKNCSVPTLTSPSTCVDVQVGVPYTITLTATNNCGATSNISDIVVQSFAGVLQGSLVQVNPPYKYTRDITYTPTNVQLGLQIMCAVALDDTNIPSDQYCITFIVSSATASICSNLLSSTSKQVSSIVQTSTSKPNQINWAFVGTGAGLGLLFSVLLSLGCCYYFFWGAAAQARRRKSKSVKKQLDYEVIDNKSGCSIPLSSLSKSDNINSDKPETLEINNCNQSDLCLPSDNSRVLGRQPSRINRIESEISLARFKYGEKTSQSSNDLTSTLSHRSTSANELVVPTLTTEIKSVGNAVQSSKASNSAQNEKEKKPKRTTKKKRLMTLITVSSIKQRKVMDIDQKSNTNGSTVHVTRVVN